MTRRVARRAALLAAASCLACGGGSAVADGEGASAASRPEMPRVVRAKCGACHRPPSPRPGRDVEDIRRLHEQRLRLDDDESAEAWGWVAGPPPKAP